MFEAIARWFFYQIPWWAYAIVFVLIVLLVWRTLGPKGALAAAVAGVLLVFRQRERQLGWQDRVNKERKDESDAIRDYKTIQEHSGSLDDSALDRANAPWVRPDAGTSNHS